MDNCSYSEDSMISVSVCTLKINPELSLHYVMKLIEASEVRIHFATRNNIKTFYNIFSRVKYTFLSSNLYLKIIK